MAKRRVNTNLVGILTATGIVLAVAVVGVTSMNAARRDPVALAEKAAVHEKAGDLRSAIGALQRAYEVNKEAKYLIEAARCARDMGEFSSMIMFLRTAYTQSPRDPLVLSALLDRYWEMREYPLGQWDLVLEYANSYLELPEEQNNVLALATKVEALDKLSSTDPTLGAECEEALERLIEIAPEDPRTLLVRVGRIIGKVQEELRSSRRTGDLDARREVIRQTRNEIAELLRGGIAANPEAVALRLTLARTLMQDERYDEAQAALEESLAAHPDHADLHFVLANVLMSKAIPLQRDESKRDELGNIAEKGLREIARAIELDPALYEAYLLQANLKQLRWFADGSWLEMPAEREKDVLDGLVSGLEETVGLRSLRAAFGGGARLWMIWRSFEIARKYHDTAPDEQVRGQATAYMRRFLQEGQTQYAEHAFVPLMEGYVALLEKNQRAAVKAFTTAEEEADESSFGAMARRTAVEELARIYAGDRQYGLALRYLDGVIEAYTSTGQTPPAWAWLARAETLIGLDRNQEAIDFIEAGDAAVREDTRATRLRALALNNLGQAEAAEKLLDSDTENVNYMFQRARMARDAGDYARAEDLLRRVHEQHPEHGPTIMLLVDVIQRAGRREDAATLVKSLLGTTQDESILRALRQLDVTLSTEDPAERDRRLLAYYQQLPDERERNNQLYNYHARRGEMDEARAYLDKLEQLAPDDLEYKQLQLALAMRDENCEMVRKYATQLAQANADQVGGATFRGRIELVCGDPVRALSEFRVAERQIPTDASLKVLVAQALLRQSPPRYDDAIDVLEQAVNFDPTYAVAHAILFSCYRSVGKSELGIRHLEAAARINPDDPFVKANSQILDEERDPESGILRREAARAASPDDVANLARLVQLYERVQNFEAAAARLAEALAAAPDDRELILLASNYYVRRNNRAAGEEILHRYIQSREGIDRIIGTIFLARFYEGLEDQEAAVRTLRDATKLADRLFPSGHDDRPRALAMSKGEIADHYYRIGDADAYIDAYRELLGVSEIASVIELQTARLRIILGLLRQRDFDEAGREIERYKADYPKRSPRLCERGAHLRQAIQARRGARIARQTDRDGAGLRLGVLHARQDQRRDAPLSRCRRRLETRQTTRPDRVRSGPSDRACPGLPHHRPSGAGRDRAARDAADQAAGRSRRASPDHAAGGTGSSRGRTGFPQ